MSLSSKLTSWARLLLVELLKGRGRGNAVTCGEVLAALWVEEGQVACTFAKQIRMHLMMVYAISRVN